VREDAWRCGPGKDWRIQELKLGGISLTPLSSSLSLFLPPSLSSLPSLSLLLPFFSFPFSPDPSPPLPLEVGPLNPARGSGGAL